MRRRSLFGVVALLMIFTMSGVGPASAATHHERDQRGDAPPRMDVIRVMYRNGPGTVSARVHFDDLKRRGRFNFIIAPPVDGDVAYVATLKIDRRGRVAKRFRITGPVGGTPAPCHFRGRWRASRDMIKVSVPQSCVEDFGGGRLYLASRFQQDWGPVVRRLARG